MRAMKLEPSSRDEWVAAASGLLLHAAFPPLEWTWAAWVALAPLLALARRAPERSAMRLAWAGAFVGWLLGIRWLTHVTVEGWACRGA